jgi:hypothetical protein
MNDAICHFPLASAFLCPDCNRVSNCSKACPACGNSAILSLANALDGQRGTNQETTPTGDLHAAA